MKQTQKHTPGPWELDTFTFGPQVGIVEKNNSGGRCIAVVDDNDEQDEANARLIAAAPDLLATCKAALEEGDDYIAVNMLRDAVAKAEGRA